ncbi:ORF6N domain-containing protein [Xenorhabdus indica]|uniref:ORF6N domain-containing protein n=1 Tax=Xenorhabdus indica TaxID=333964 RepID=UPI0016576428|nr:ORF6N domain-containing protein [Xenorhabdus indica]MBC8946775.1 antirepressor [Xenorhabdus indica]
MSKKNELVTIDSNELPVIEWQGVRVVTTETLAAGYGTEATNVRSNIANHRSRFIEGVHVFTLKGDDFRAFKNQVNNIDLVNKHTNQVTLFTEIGDFIINEC